ncbi:MAG: hypothetical protein E6344_18150 [Clostridium sp.]|uniref:DUF6877 family protein n=1 Tax=Clostridium culturomicium TaxID=1499683 RepID=UPI00291281E7|nr:hypothetical protein [Clostridium sp.]MDU7085620.1 hypothetical protein [Clostridium sp.]
MVEINNIEDLGKVCHMLPLVILEDINKRIGDWLAAGEDINHPYVINQCKYAERVINSQRRPSSDEKRDNSVINFII